MNQDKESKMEREGYLVSFCIPTYNNGAGVDKTVKALLENPSDKIQVVVVDNASGDDTVERMSLIDDERLQFKVNNKNYGAKRNWYHALEAGDGEWLYLVMGRDMLDCQYLDRFLDMLEKINCNVGFLLDRNKKSFPEFYVKDASASEKVDAVIKFIDMLHPTGSIFRRTAYREIKNRKHYFYKEHPYPENYIKRDILAKYHGACIDGRLYGGRYNVIFRNIRSHFEENASVPWYYPQKKLEQFLTDVHMVEESGKFNFSETDYEIYYCKRWKSLLDGISFGWKKSLESVDFARHYGIPCRHVSKREMINYILRVYINTLRYYESRKGLGRNKRKRILFLTLKQIMRVLFYPLEIKK